MIDIQGYPIYLYTADAEIDGIELGVALGIFDYNDEFYFLMLASDEYREADIVNRLEYVVETVNFKDNLDSSQATEESPEAREDEIVIGKEIDFDDFTIVVQGYRLAKDYNGEDVLVVKYDWTNNSDETNSPLFTFMFKAFQGGVETDSASMVKDVDVSSSLKDVRPGGTLEGIETAVGVVDINKPLELELDLLISFQRNPYIVDLDLAELK